MKIIVELVNLAKKDTELSKGTTRRALT
jgi:hypothetical protein